MVALSDAIVELASVSAGRPEFQRLVLSAIDESIGHSHAFFACCSGMTASGYSPEQLALVKRRAQVFKAELAPVERVAAERGGVAVDTAVLGHQARQCRYYRELVSPAGGGHSLLCWLQWRGRSQGLIMLGRDGNGFRDREVDVVRRVAPTLALALASFAPVAEHAQLSPREHDIAAYLRLGYTNAEIASALGRSPNTVRNQLAAMFVKMGATTRTELLGLLLRE